MEKLTLKIITNDEKFIKSATSLLGESRVMTPHAFIEKVIKVVPHDNNLKAYKDASLKAFKLKKFNYRKINFLK